MDRILSAALAFIIAMPFGAEAATRAKRPAAERTQSGRPVLEQDEFRSCDVSVRDFVQGRREATALPVKDVEVDSLRMTLNFVHPYGKSGDTPPNLAFTRGESIEERRRALNETKQKIQTLVAAAKSGSVWYVIALTKDDVDGNEARRSPVSVQPDEDHPSASAVVMASIDNKCIIVSEYKAVPVSSLGDELRRLLGAEPRQGPVAEPAPEP